MQEVRCVHVASKTSPDSRPPFKAIPVEGQVFILCAPCLGTLRSRMLAEFLQDAIMAGIESAALMTQFDRKETA